MSPPTFHGKDMNTGQLCQASPQHPHLPPMNIVTGAEDNRLPANLGTEVVTLEDEIYYIWVRYYSIALLVFDTPNSHLCHSRNNLGQLVAVINVFLFAGSVPGFLWISAQNTAQQKVLTTHAIHQPLLGCPVVHSMIEWTQ
ncbi:hypothetical protein DFS33DRAFT_1277098 [Desarmillaria ectypa]|nr:hypothetical protein DFS33DRAFT_1277098 [Desarmillaria ectypa]